MNKVKKALIGSMVLLGIVSETPAADELMADINEEVAKNNIARGFPPTPAKKTHFLTAGKLTQSAIFSPDNNIVEGNYLIPRVSENFPKTKEPVKGSKAPEINRYYNRDYYRLDFRGFDLDDIENYKKEVDWDHSSDTDAPRLAENDSKINVLDKIQPSTDNTVYEALEESFAKLDTESILDKLKAELADINEFVLFNNRVDADNGGTSLPPEASDVTSADATFPTVLSDETENTTSAYNKTYVTIPFDEIDTPSASSITGVTTSSDEADTPPASSVADVTTSSDEADTPPASSVADVITPADEADTPPASSVADVITPADEADTPPASSVADVITPADEADTPPASSVADVTTSSDEADTPPASSVADAITPADVADAASASDKSDMTAPLNEEVEKIVIEPPPVDDQLNSADSVNLLPRAEAGIYAANMASAHTLFATRSSDRSGAAHYHSDVNNGDDPIQPSLWMHVAGGQNKARLQNGAISTRTNSQKVMLGGDIFNQSLNNVDGLHVGVLFGAGKTSSHSQVTKGNSAKGGVSGQTVGIYSTWYSNDENQEGPYLDGQLNYGWFDNHLDVKATGAEAAFKDEYRSRGFVGSLEAGYTWKLFNHGTYNTYLQPQMQVTWMGVNAKDHLNKQGATVSMLGANNVQIRLGSRLYMSGCAGADIGKQRVFQPYIELNAIHNTKDFGVKLDNAQYRLQGAKHIGEAKIGTEGQINQSLSIWGGIGQQVGASGYHATQGTLGVKVNF